MSNKEVRVGWMKLVSVNSKVALVNQYDEPISGVVSLQVNQATGEITTATVVLQVYTDEGEPAFHSLGLKTEDLKGDQ